MAKANAQIHIGPHNVIDKTDTNGYQRPAYDRYLKETLMEINDRVIQWSKKCLCESDPKKDPKQTTHQFHNNLDNLSGHMQSMITGHRSTWEVFLSKYAMEYSKKGNEGTTKK